MGFTGHRCNLLAKQLEPSWKTQTAFQHPCTREGKLDEEMDDGEWWWHKNLSPLRCSAVLRMHLRYGCDATHLSWHKYSGSISSQELHRQKKVTNKTRPDFSQDVVMMRLLLYLIQMESLHGALSLPYDATRNMWTNQYFHPWQVCFGYRAHKLQGASLSVNKTWSSCLTTFAEHIRNMICLSSRRNLLMLAAVVRIAKEPFHARERLQNKLYTYIDWADWIALLASSWHLTAWKILNEAEWNIGVWECQCCADIEQCWVMWSWNEETPFGPQLLCIVVKREYW